MHPGKVSKLSVEISAGEGRPAIFTLLMEKGSGARIKILQSGAYVLGSEIGDHEKVPLRSDRRYGA